MSGSPKGRTTACAVSMFPCRSQTFIVREILALGRSGAKVRTFLLEQPHEGYMHEAERPPLEEVIHPHALRRFSVLPLQRVSSMPEKARTV